MASCCSAMRAIQRRLTWRRVRHRRLKMRGGARCLDQFAYDDISTALAVYAASRKERTDRMQFTNRENTWLRQKTDTDWVYEDDAWHAPLA